MWEKRERCTTQKRDNARYPCAEALAVVTRKDGFSKATNAAVSRADGTKEMDAIGDISSRCIYLYRVKYVSVVTGRHGGPCPDLFSK